MSITKFKSTYEYTAVVDLSVSSKVVRPSALRSDNIRFLSKRGKWRRLVGLWLMFCGKV